MTEEIKTFRQKGTIISSLPDDYVVIDLETTGFDPKWCDIIEIAALKVKNNIIVDTFSSLVNPLKKLSNFTKTLTGITDEMLKDAPEIKKILPEFLTFIDDSIVLGHNVNFDINFIYDNKIRIFNEPFKNDYIDTLRISRKVLPNLHYHRLKDLAEYFSIDFEKQHRSLEDCIAAYKCYLNLKKLAVDNNIDLNFTHKSIKAKDITATTSDFDENHLLFDKTCVFTGKLEKLTRKEAMQIVANFGGINADKVTKSTNYLILGNNDFCQSIKDGKSSKQKKAEKLILEGQDLQIISEDTFYDMAFNNDNEEVLV